VSELLRAMISMRFFAIDEIAKEWVSGEYCEITSE
jgi:hypothetical protein